MAKEATIIKTEEKIVKRELQPHCPYCGSENVYGISRVVGYYSRIENWNKGKQIEFLARQKGNYIVE